MKINKTEHTTFILKENLRKDFSIKSKDRFHNTSVSCFWCSVIILRAFKKPSLSRSVSRWAIMLAGCKTKCLISQRAADGRRTPLRDKFRKNLSCATAYQSGQISWCSLNHSDIHLWTTFDFFFLAVWIILECILWSDFFSFYQNWRKSRKS